MQRNIKSLTGCSLEATDGEIGEVKDFYFEDNSWIINYLIVKTGNWLSSRKVLISPQALVKRKTEGSIFPVNLTREQIKTSPDVDTDKPVSRQQDIALYGHYAWERYGGSGFYAGGTMGAINADPIIDEKIMTEADPHDKRSDDDLHLRSTENIFGYSIHASDGDFGHVTDFIFDDSNWKIIYLVVDSHKWFGGEKHLVKTTAVEEIQWENSKVILNISTEAIKNASLFDEMLFQHDESVSAPSENS